MQLDMDTLKQLVQTRVTVRHLTSGTHYTSTSGQMRGLRPDFVFVDEVKIYSQDILSIEADPLICEECGVSTLTLSDGRCAPCYREAASKRKNTTHCDNCGAPDAFRNPADRVSIFFCGPCHRERGESLPLVGSVAGLVAECRTFDVMDPRHSMKHVKGNQFACEVCKIKTHNPELRKLMKETFPYVN